MTYKREIKSFIKRNGRISNTHKNNIKKLFPKYGSYADSGVIASTMFNNNNPICLDIGFGMGDSILNLAITNPGLNFIGIEVHEAGIGKVLGEIEDKEIKNIRLFMEDANIILQKNISNLSLHSINIFFPDPWHKTKHNKRRLIQPNFMQELHVKLKVDGEVNIATDDSGYTNHIQEVLTKTTDIFNTTQLQNSYYTSKRPLTKYAKRARDKNNTIVDFTCIKI